MKFRNVIASALLLSCISASSAVAVEALPPVVTLTNPNAVAASTSCAVPQIRYIEAGLNASAEEPVTLIAAQNEVIFVDADPPAYGSIVELHAPRRAWAIDMSHCSSLDVQPLPAGWYYIFAEEFEAGARLRFKLLGAADGAMQLDNALNEAHAADIFDGPLQPLHLVDVLFDELTTLLLHVEPPAYLVKALSIDPPIHGTIPPEPTLQPTVEPTSTAAPTATPPSTTHQEVFLPLVQR